MQTNQDQGKQEANGRSEPREGRSGFATEAAGVISCPVNFKPGISGTVK